ncbi:hypothetical protein FCJ61_30670 [Burkholderia metallica]|nr:hypothetical protein [Burkholderia metallica]
MGCYSSDFSLRFARAVIIRRDFRANYRNLNIVIDPSNHYLTNRIGRAGTDVITRADRVRRTASWLRHPFAASSPAHRNPGRNLTFVYNNHSHLQNC